MKQTRLIMGMPVSVEVVDSSVTGKAIDAVFEFFEQVDKRYSTYKKDSEISQINAGLLRAKWSAEMKQVLQLCEQTKQQTAGFFDIKRNGSLDPSGLVKGWAIAKAAGLLTEQGYKNFYIDAGGDIQTSGHNADGQPWRVGVQNPFNRQENVKIVDVHNRGVATSGTYIRGQHIYNPKNNRAADEIASVTVIGPSIYDADRFATAAFAMGEQGINFLEGLADHEAYIIKKDKTAVMTSGFERYVAAT